MKDFLPLKARYLFGKKPPYSQTSNTPVKHITGL